MTGLTSDTATQGEPGENPGEPCRASGNEEAAAGANQVDQEAEGEEDSSSSEEEDFERMVRISKGFNHALQLSGSSSEEDETGD